MDVQPRVQGLVRGEDFLHDQPGVLADELAKTSEVAERVGQAVGVVDADAVDKPLVHKFLKAGVGGVEDVLVLLAHAGQTVDGEETAVGDDAVAPELEAVVLSLVHGGRVVVEIGVAAGGEREDVVVVGEHVLAVDVFQLQRVGVAWCAEYRQRDLAAGAVVGGPVDVEEVRVVRGPAVFEHVPPPPVAPRHLHAEVVGHDIHHQPQPGVVGGAGEQAQPVNAAELRVDHGRVDHVVVVVGLRRGSEDRGEVEVRDPEFGQVGHELGGLGEAEFAAVRIGVRAA